MERETTVSNMFIAYAKTYFDSLWACFLPPVPLKKYAKPLEMLHMPAKRDFWSAAGIINARTDHKLCGKLSSEPGRTSKS